MSFAEYQKGRNDRLRDPHYLSGFHFAEFVECCLGEMLDSYARETTRKAVDILLYRGTEYDKEQMMRAADRIYTVNQMAELSKQYKISVFAEEIAKEEE